MERVISIITAAALAIAGASGATAPENGAGEKALTKAEMSVKRDTTFALWSTYVKTRKIHPEVRIFPPLLPKGVSAMENIAYTVIKMSDGDRPLRCDVFRPDDGRIYPAVIMIHGGGWNSGTRQLQVPLAQRLAAAGFVAIPVEYRLIPEALYPAGLYDIKTAVRWARANADRYGIDPDHIAVWGCSAGAQLATLAGVTNGSARHEGDGEYPGVSSEVQGVVSIDGIATFLTDSNLQSVEEHIAKRGSNPVNAQWLGGVYTESPEHWEEASALNWITERSAPVCFINSELPRYREGRDVLRARYAALGIATEAHSVGSPFHPFWLFQPYAAGTLSAAIPFLTRTLKSNRLPPRL